MTSSTVSDALEAQSFWLPIFHLTGQRNWINDPNGLTHHHGRYHLFYQAAPDTPVWGPPHWGHATSTDLCHWQRHPAVLSPSTAGPDRDGCWSGCLRFVEGKPVIYYTAVVRRGRKDYFQTVCVAVGTDDLMSWQAQPEPLISVVPTELSGGNHRDPFVWRDERGWHMLMGVSVGDAEPQGAIGLYHSTDASTWSWAGLFMDGLRELDGIDLGQVWECPQLIQSGGSWILLVSCQLPGAARHLLYTVAFVGTMSDYRFTPAQVTFLDAGDALYAATIGTDAAGLPVTVGWIQDVVPRPLARQLTKAGAISAPRTVGIEKGVFVSTIHQAWYALPRRPVDQAEDGTYLTQGHFEVVVEDQSQLSGLRMASEGPDRVDIDIDRAAGTVRVTVSDPLGTRTQLSRIQSLRSQQGRTLVIVDGSIVEVFVNGAPPITTRWYRYSESVSVIPRANGERQQIKVSAIDSTVKDG
jgi:beta-fructofuranosidase